MKVVDIMFDKSRAQRTPVFLMQKPKASELALIASFIALAFVGRAVFFMTPFFKPVSAIVITAGITMGGVPGFIVGALSMLISDFVYGLGPWTLLQMLGMGLVGFVAGVMTRWNMMPDKRLFLCITGFIITVVVYGGTVNASSFLLGYYDVSWEMIMAVYLSGIPADIVHGISTFIFLWIGAATMFRGMRRIKKLYGVFLPNDIYENS